LYLQRVLGYGAAETSLAGLPIAVVLALVSLGLAAPLNTRFGPRRVLLVGLALIMGALALFTLTPVDGGYIVNVLPSMLLLGAGAGVAMPAVMTWPCRAWNRATQGLLPAWRGLVHRSAGR
jgi:Na+/melibiose symporter-like transporter